MKAKVKAYIEFDVHLVSIHEGSSTFLANQINNALRAKFTGPDIKKLTVTVEPSKEQEKKKK